MAKRLNRGALGAGATAGAGEVQARGEPRGREGWPGVGALGRVPSATCRPVRDPRVHRGAKTGDPESEARARDDTAESLE